MRTVRMGPGGARWWCCLVLVLGMGGAGAESLLNSVSRNLELEMEQVLASTTINYTDLISNATYISNLVFDMRAMGMLYNIAPIAMHLIADKQPYPPGIITVSDGHVELPPGGLLSKWRPLLSHYAGPVSALTTSLLLGAALPVAGVLWCCSALFRSRRRRPFDGQYDGVVRGILATLLILLLTLFLFGIVCVFVTDSQVEEGVHQSTKSVRRLLADVATFVDDATLHVRWLIQHNYAELERKLNAVMESSGVTISVQVGELSRAVSVSTLARMVRQLGPVRTQLQELHQLTIALRNRAETLNAGLRTVKKQLLETLARCSQPQCVQLQEKHKIGQLDTEIHYSQMPDVSSLLRNVSALVDSGLAAEVEEGEATFRNLQRDIRNAVQEQIPKVQQVLAQGRDELTRVVKKIIAFTQNAQQKIKQAQELPDKMDRQIKKYSPYLKYLGLGLGTALLAALAVLSLGLVCGVCGRRAVMYGGGNHCASKAAGAKCLFCGAAMLFLIGGATSVALGAYLVAGVGMQRFVCDPLFEPRGNQIIMDLERLVDLEMTVYDERTDAGFNITQIAVDCHANRTIFVVLQLHRALGVRAAQTRMRAEVSRGLQELRTQLRSTSLPHLTILRPDTKRKLHALATSGLSDFDFDKILDALDTNMTSLRLDELGAQLERAASSLAARPGFGDTAADLHRAASRLTQYHTDILQPMMTDAHKLNQTALELRETLRFNHSSLREAISYLLDETAQAENFLNTQGPQIVHKMTESWLINVIETTVEFFLERLVMKLSKDVANCGPISKAFNATRDAHCQNILLPWHGYWLSLLWCLSVVIPVMAVSVRLARLYGQCRPHVEAEYLYDAYADRDNVPLANAYKAEKRGGRGARRPPPLADDAPPVHAHHARRYNDMAPNLSHLSASTLHTNTSITHLQTRTACQGTGKKGPHATTALLSTSDPLHTTIQDPTIDSKVALTELDDDDLLKY